MQVLPLEEAAGLLGRLSQRLERQFEVVSLEDESYTGVGPYVAVVEEDVPVC